MTAAVEKNGGVVPWGRSTKILRKIARSARGTTLHPT
jgi:hypothetical protein